MTSVSPPSPPSRSGSTAGNASDVAHNELLQLLVPGEVIEATAAQIRLYALLHRRSVVAATTNRFIGLTRGLFGDYKPIDVRWQDLKEAKLTVGVFAATLIVQASGPTDLAVSGNASNVIVFGGLEKTAAHAVYRICQSQEQAWREKRRVRELEEMRARSGGFQLGAAGTGAPFSGGMVGMPAAGAMLSPDSRQDPVERLAQAKEMLAKGLITDSEYEAMKARIISAL